jgi:hypothetical protein
MRNNTTLVNATRKLVEAIVALLKSRNDPRLFYDRSRAVLELCTVALTVGAATQADADRTGVKITQVSIRGDLGSRIAELRASGYGVRQIARILAVEPSTVSRRLRRKNAIEGVTGRRNIRSPVLPVA